MKLVLLFTLTKQSSRRKRRRQKSGAKGKLEKSLFIVIRVYNNHHLCQHNHLSLSLVGLLSSRSLYYRALDFGYSEGFSKLRSNLLAKLLLQFSQPFTNYVTYDEGLSCAALLPGNHFSILNWNRSLRSPSRNPFYPALSDMWAFKSTKELSPKVHEKHRNLIISVYLVSPSVSISLRNQYRQRGGVGPARKEDTKHFAKTIFLLDSLYVNSIVISCFWLSRSDDELISLFLQNEPNVAKSVGGKQSSVNRSNSGFGSGIASPWADETELFRLGFFIISPLNNNLFLFIWILCRLRFIPSPLFTILLPLRSATGISFRSFALLPFVPRWALAASQLIFYPVEKLNFAEVRTGKTYMQNKSVDEALLSSSPNRGVLW